MTADQAFLSWANWIKENLATAAPEVMVSMYSEDTLAEPYLFLEQGPETPAVKSWISSLFAQAHLVVNRIEGEKVEVTAIRLRDKIRKALRDPGNLIKYDYSTGTPVAAGQFFFNAVLVGPELSSLPDRSERVLRFELHTSNKI